MTFGIIGFGRFGKFFAGVLSQKGRVVVYSRRDISKEAGMSGLETGDLTEVCGSDVVIIATSIRETEETLKKISSYLREGTVLIDVASVKLYTCRLLKRYAPPGVFTLGTHPMFGPDSAKNGIDKLMMVFCPLKITAKKLEDMRSLFSSLGLKIVECTPDEHDRQSAKSLTLVHFIGRGLDGLDLEKQRVATKGYEYLLELKNNVLNDSKTLFEDMHAFNPYAEDVRKKFLHTLEKIDHTLK